MRWSKDSIALREPLKIHFYCERLQSPEGGVVRPNFVLEEAIGYACGDFDLPPEPGKISHILVTKAIFRGPLNERRNCRFTEDANYYYFLQILHIKDLSNY